MQNTMYNKLLITLNREEFYEFELFLKYILKARPKCLSLYKIIKNNYVKNNEHWNKIDLTAAQIYTALYKKEMPKNTSVLRELSSEFLSYLKHYCAYLQFKKNEQEYYFKYLYHNEVNSLFEIEFKKIQSGSNQIYGTETSWKEFEFMELYLRKQIKKVVSHKIDIEQYFTSYIKLNTEKKLQILCIIEQNAIIKSFEIGSQIQYSFEAVLEKNIPNKNSGLLHRLYYDSILMLRNAQDNYEPLKEKIYQNNNKIAEYDRYVLISSLLAYCNLKIQNASAEIITYFREEQQFHYFFMYEEGLLNDGKYVMAMHVKNICLLAVLRTKSTGRLKLNLKEAKKIIEESKEKITPQYAESTYNFNMAVFYFFVEEPEKTIELLLRKNQYINYHFTCDSNLYLLKCYYLTEDASNFDKKVASFRESLRRDQYLSLQDKDSYKNAIRAMVRLKKIKDQISFQYKYNPNKHIEKLKETITNKPIQSIDWFMQQLALLAK